MFFITVNKCVGRVFVLFGFLYKTKAMLKKKKKEKYL